MKQAFKKLPTKLFWGFFRHLLSDRKYAELRYWLELDEWPDIDHPEKFTEKMQHIKLFDRQALRKQAANRITVRNYVAEKIGADHLVPLMDSFEELTPHIWEALPSQFVLKANHGCGMLKIIADKSQHDFEAVRQEVNRWQNTDYYSFSREWAYKDLPRTILAEQLLLTPNGSIPKDYKFFCFNGEVKLIQIDYDRFNEQKRNLYDPQFNRIDGKLLYPTYPKPTEKPPNFHKGLEIAEALSVDFNFIRVDLYLMDANIYFGELTNYPGNGFIPFEPESLEYKMGSHLTL